MAETVRFSGVVAASGVPEVYLPLADPKHDKDFMRAVREQRVLSLKQEPTGTKKDFGTVGFVAERFVSYLIFPKSLREFEGKRVVGIKYDKLKEAELTTPTAARKAQREQRAVKPKPKPQPQRFTATVRVTATNEVKVTVDAWNEKEARAKAAEAASAQADLSSARIEKKLLRVKKELA